MKTSTEKTESAGDWITRERWWPLVTFVGATTLLLWGWLMQPVELSPYVRVSGSVLSLKVNCIPEAVEVAAYGSGLDLTRARLLIRAGDSVTPFTLTPSRVVDKDAAKVAVGLSASTATDAVRTRAQLKEPSVYLVMAFKSRPFFDLKEVKLKTAQVVGKSECEEALRGGRLAELIGEGKPQVMRFFQPQEKLGDVVHAINPVLGPLLICVLVIWSGWILVQLSFGAKRYFRTKAHTKQACLKRLEHAPAALRIKGIEKVLVADHLRVLRRLAFARVLGPAIGFLLTVSSLIEGLHPMEQSAQSTFGFMSALQIALVATFAGLVLRIVAECAIRMYRQVLDRELLAVMEVPDVTG